MGNVGSAVTVIGIIALAVVIGIGTTIKGLRALTGGPALESHNRLFLWVYWLVVVPLLVGLCIQGLSGTVPR